MRKLFILNSHPIQYFTPLYKLASRYLELEVLYCSDETLRGVIDREFSIEVKWDIPLLEGYNYTFYKNFSLTPSLFKGFWGLINFTLLNRLRKEKPSIILVHGWGYFTHFLVLLFGKYWGHTVLLRSETPYNQEKKKNILLQIAKRAALQILFSGIDVFLYIGKENKIFYNSLGITNDRLVFAPYCVDNERFIDASTTFSKSLIRQKRGFTNDDKIFLFVGKLIEKKRPLDLIKALQQCLEKKYKIFFVGDGILKNSLIQYTKEYNLEDQVFFYGFVNQIEISEYYSLADVFVMCSDIGETWGLSVNEALNFNIPIIVSSITGCSTDLIFHGINGYVFEVGNITELAKALKDASCFGEKELTILKKKNAELLSVYNYNTIVQGLQSIVKK